jgi:hypothetical protein
VRARDVRRGDNADLPGTALWAHDVAFALDNVDGAEDPVQAREESPRRRGSPQDAQASVARNRWKRRGLRSAAREDATSAAVRELDVSRRAEDFADAKVEEAIHVRRT